MPEKEKLKKYYTVREIAEVLAVSPPTIEKWVHNGIIPQPVRFGTVRRWAVDNFEIWLAKKNVGAVGGVNTSDLREQH